MAKHDPILIRRLTPKNFLSFGPDSEGIELKALNLLIGPNGSGKSNFIEAISLTRSAPRDWRDVIRKGGGVGEWIWKGGKQISAAIELNILDPNDPEPLVHGFEFSKRGESFDLIDEWVMYYENPPDNSPYYLYHLNDNGKPLLRFTTKGNVLKKSSPEITSDTSILSQRKDPDTYSELTYISEKYEKIRIYREWSFGRNTVFREPQRADMRNDRLEEDFSNLGLFLNRLKTRFPTAKRALMEALKNLYDGIDDFEISIEGGTVQVYFTEGNFSIPATRLSDGTLRYLCLLAILLDPQPPPLICLEEPELGLHPDILPTIADLLKAASKRTQLIVTTHSDILVDAMTETPECVVVFEKHDGQTEMNRLSAEELSVWLEKYRLGQLWIQGQIGGTRW